MKNEFKTGCNFDLKLLDNIVQLNEEFSDKGVVKEWFGSTAKNHHLSARPQWRLQNISDKDFETFVRKSLDNNIVFNYTLNSIQPYGSKTEMLAHKSEIHDFVKYLEDIGVYRITIANPMLAMIIREVSDINLEASCIMHIDTVTQFKYLHENLGITKFCNSILKNRNKLFLKNAADYCNSHGLILELLAQEFCGVAGEGYATHCVYRDSCYLCHATNVTKEDSMSYNNYPMNFCMGSRNSNEESWIRMRFLRPEDLHYYNDIGINYFKISGRTGSTEYLTKCIKAYLSQNYEGNLLGLWKPLETIYNGTSENSHNFETYINNKKLDGFLDHWFSTEDGFECENQLCGTTCNYCHDFFMNKVKQ